MFGVRSEGYCMFGVRSEGIAWVYYSMAVYIHRVNYKFSHHVIGIKSKHGKKWHRYIYGSDGGHPTPFQYTKAS